MKISTVSTVLSALVLSVVAANAMAANPNGPKPKCPLGQIPVLENNRYHCEVPSIKAQSTPSRSTTSAPKKERPGRPVPQLKKAQLKLADLRIMGAKLKNGTPATFVVTVKNQGNAAAPANSLFGQHFMKDNSSWGGGAIIPAMGPGATKKVEITVLPNNNYTFGDKMVFTADWAKKVTESNETNNIFSVKYPKNPV
jgi:hypothetical protein